MFLGIDFLINAQGIPFVSEVNIGLPGGIFEHELIDRYIYRKKTAIFDYIEKICEECYGKSFRDYIRGNPEFDSHRKFKMWMDKTDKLPEKLFPLFRLEDKWNQYNLLKNDFPLPYTEIFTGSHGQIDKFKEKFGKIALKRRCGRWSKGFRVIENNMDAGPAKENYICQQFIDSKINDYIFSVRINTLGGFFLCLSGDLTPSYESKWRYIAAIEEGGEQKLERESFDILDVLETSWEGKIWCDDNINDELKLNLTRDKIAITKIFLKKETIKTIRKTASGISNLYEKLDPSILPPAFFEK